MSDYQNIGGMRKSYNEGHTTFSEQDLVSDEPMGQFESWFKKACETPHIDEANAMCLATATKEGVPSARYVLLKGNEPEYQ